MNILLTGGAGYIGRHTVAIPYQAKSMALSIPFK